MGLTGDSCGRIVVVSCDRGGVSRVGESFVVPVDLNGDFVGNENACKIDSRVAVGVFALVLGFEAAAIPFPLLIGVVILPGDTFTRPSVSIVDC